MHNQASSDGPALTGHPEIDAQHLQLTNLISKLGKLCAVQELTGTVCLQCPAEHRSCCTDRLAGMLGELLGFMLTHFSYEEKLMLLLPKTAACEKHIESHKYAHAEISQRLTDLTLKLDKENPQQCSLQLQKVIAAWIGKHEINFDAKLATQLEKAYDAEIAYDIELASLLPH